MTFTRIFLLYEKNKRLTKDKIYLERGRADKIGCG